MRFAPDAILTNYQRILKRETAVPLGKNTIAYYAVTVNRSEGCSPFSW